MASVLVVVLSLVTVTALVAVVAIGQAWRQSCRRIRQLALRLDAEQRLDAATLQTLQAMRDAARQHLRQR